MRLLLHHVTVVRLHLGANACDRQHHHAASSSPPPPPPPPPHIQDNRTYVHINSWVSPSGARATNLGLLAVGVGDDLLKQPLGGVTPLSPPAPVLLSVTNDTIVPLLRMHAGVETPVPLLVYVGGNVTLGGSTGPEDGPAGSAELAGAQRLPAAAANDSSPARALAPRENITIARPVVLVGRSSDPTSIDFRMRVNQLVAAGPHANLTLDSLLLENLGFGDVVSAPTAFGVQTQSTFSIWWVGCCASVLGVVLLLLSCCSGW